MSGIDCYFCNQPVDPKTAYRMVEGWQRPGKGLNNQSGSSLVCRRPRSQVPHSECIAREKARVSVYQETLA